MLSGKMDEEAGIESPTNKQKGTTPQVIAKAGNTWRIESAGMDIRAAAWATPALRPRGRDGIFSGLMQYDAGMPDARANGRGGG